jgi:hypothetical protein
MKKLVIIILILTANITIFASLSFNDTDAEKKTLCQGYRAKSYTHLSIVLEPIETVNCCSKSIIQNWCDFSMESSICDEHLKLRVKQVCIAIPEKTDGGNEEEGEEEEEEGGNDDIAQ